VSGIEQAEIMLAGRLDGKQCNRVKRLLDMMYKPSELAEEVGFGVNQVYMVYVPAGCPHQLDAKNHIWINGKAFREWVEEVYKKRSLEPDEMFCLTCKRPVKMIEPERKQKDGLVYYVSKCPNCGRVSSKIVDQKKKSGNAQS
jgi:DNA-directed RNA polymerase subunit RPC12/RpoP